MRELIDFILVRLYYRLFVRPRSAVKTASEWEIDLPGMKAAYRGPQAKGQSPFMGRTMDFYVAGDGEDGKTLCGGLGAILAEAQTVLDNMLTRQRKQFLRRLIEEGDRVFRAEWKKHHAHHHET
ncbi:MAG: hypothetical protein LBI86_08845 [Treponema sp.]|jgi:hypothetical protein|nr:hypothetical protein [Treponema sp.]